MRRGQHVPTEGGSEQHEGGEESGGGEMQRGGQAMVHGLQCLSRGRIFILGAAERRCQVLWLWWRQHVRGHHGKTLVS